MMVNVENNLYKSVHIEKCQWLLRTHGGDKNEMMVTMMIVRTWCSGYKSGQTTSC